MYVARAADIQVHASHERNIGSFVRFFLLVIIFSKEEGRLRKYHTRLNWACQRTRYEKR